ncbi:hypothetical protein G3I40_37475 [Streptomyces sp. SID14478]|uniref:hypothetical protein n=1 Tax=Streptomyces sp. SID14478 TaxID=2706073 RepID=UPI0013E099E1|nr:hypothetical protein [Streptomyces sp. SID14478]NEB80861.1 hypothetical protein [Streptomyces sp. SID14478]
MPLKNRRTGKRLRASIAAGVLATSTAVALLGAPGAQAAPAERQVVGRSGSYAIVVTYKPRSGTTKRAISMIAIDRNVSKYKGTLRARWLYKKPGGSAHVGKSWRKAAYTSEDGSRWYEAWWGRRNHYSGLSYPKGTKFCGQFKDNAKKVCVTLK